jgi:hypothetical protein
MEFQCYDERGRQVNRNNWIPEAADEREAREGGFAPCPPRHECGRASKSFKSVHVGRRERLHSASSSEGAD